MFCKPNTNFFTTNPLFIRLFVLFFCILSYQNLESQNIADPDCPEEFYYDPNDFSILSPIHSELDYAIGWALQDNGTWASQQNVIPSTNTRSQFQNERMIKMGQDNFVSLQLRKITIKDKQYSILLKIYEDGEFEFPILEQGWKSYHSLEFYIFDSHKLKELLPDDVPYNVKYLVNLECFATGIVRNYTRIIDVDRKKLPIYNYYSTVARMYSNKKSDPDAVIVRHIQNVLAKNVITDANIFIAVHPIRETGKEIVRFKFVTTYLKEDLNKRQASPDNWRNNLYDNNYYEVDFYEYQRFIRDAEQYYVDMITVGGTDEISSSYQYGIIRYNTGDFLGASQAFDEAISKNPNGTDFLVYSYRGNARSKMGKFNDAISDFSRAISLKPTHVQDYSNWVKNYYNRGVAKYYLGDQQGACDDWKRSFDLGYGSAEDLLMNYCSRRLN
jgi:tetratricopeptide (TPR) repeat protein